jgi:hypothetical protein
MGYRPTKAQNGNSHLLCRFLAVWDTRTVVASKHERQPIYTQRSPPNQTNKSSLEDFICWHSAQLSDARSLHPSSDRYLTDSSDQGTLPIQVTLQREAVKRKAVKEVGPTLCLLLNAFLVQGIPAIGATSAGSTTDIEFDGMQKRTSI